MQFLKNKHLIMAMFIAPVLAIIAYYAVDQFVSETPHVAVQGSSYKLAAKSNCRYKSGLCTFENGDIEVKLRAETIDNNQLKIILSSVVPLRSALVSLVNEGENTEPTIMTESQQQSDVWTAVMDKSVSDKSILRLAINVSDTLYYAETTTIFINYETSFSQQGFAN